MVDNDYTIVLMSEAFYLLVLVLKNPSKKIVCYTNIEHTSGRICHYVNKPRIHYITSYESEDEYYYDNIAICS